MTSRPRPTPDTAAIISKATTGVKNTTSTVTLASLAMLRVRADVVQQDYVDYLVPFVKHVLREVNFNPVTGVAVKELIRDEFGLYMPVQAVELVLKRLARAPYNILQKLSHQWHVTQPEALEDIGPRRSAALRDMDTLVGELATFARDQYRLEWTSDTTTDVLTAYLSSFSIDCLAAFERNSALPVVPQVGNESLFVVNSFVDHCIKMNPDALERLIVVVKGTMLANALLCPDLDYVQQKFNGVTFYLDTPLIMRLLELDDDPRRGGVQDLISLLSSLNGRVAVFQHTIDEVRGVLDYYEANISNPAVQHYRIAAVRAAGTTGSDIRLISEKLEETLQSQGILCEYAIPYIKDYQIDEALLAQVLYDDIPYRTERGRDRDVDSMRCIYTLREGRRPRRLEESVAVLVTSNAQLAQTAFEFGKNNESTREVSSVVTDFTVANLAWLKSPVQYDRVPFTEMVAASFAAMNPSETLWDKMLGMVDRLRASNKFSQHDHELLRVSPIVRRELMNLTLGTEAAFTTETAQEVLSRIKADLVRDKNLEFDDERKKQADAHAQEMARRDALLAERERESQLRQKELEDAQQLASAEAEAKRKLLAAEDKRLSHLFAWASLLGKAASILTAVVLSIIVLISVAWTVFACFIDTSSEKFKKVASSLTLLAAVAALIWGLPSAIWGISIIGVMKAVESRVRRRSYKAFCRAILGETPQKDDIDARERNLA